MLFFFYVLLGKFSLAAYLCDNYICKIKDNDHIKGISALALVGVCIIFCIFAIIINKYPGNASYFMGYIIFQIISFTFYLAFYIISDIKYCRMIAVSFFSNYGIIIIYFCISKSFNYWLLLVLFITNVILIPINILSYKIDFIDYIAVPFLSIYQNITFIYLFYAQEGNLGYIESLAIFNYYIFFEEFNFLKSNLCCDLCRFLGFGQ